MIKDQLRDHMVNIGVMPAIRVASAADARFAADAVAAGGIPIVEITLTVPDAVDVIRELVAFSPKMTVGAGTVLTAEMAMRCMDAGAQYITTPALKLDVIAATKQRDILVIPGAMTPTEVLMAWESGADLVKVYPCSALGGPSYVRALKRPFPNIPMIAAGGISQQNAAEYIQSGAEMIGIGASLVAPESVSHHEARRIQELARRYLAIVAETRRTLSGME
ncbi:MAG TPA: bifunctional 4-hydroxy-2-oxoglutarate aldolase/2-dehydro-3-deoxy-phosphogluconate aldolase [Candidatus Acidoferrales bacterium]|nr:bifunctional 4-hydroxy-2-oxoglutarate aldolase/2-dehydro-3-deoxy-phosphogluconate aldolase [Candidatus Acidoferrales bacterium]